MSLTIISADDPHWREVVMRLPYDLREVTISAEFAKAHAKAGETPLLAVFETPTHIIAQSFIERPVGQRSDIVTISGPMSSAAVHSRSHGEQFEAAWEEWLMDCGIISEFCLLNPLFEAEQLPLVNHIDGRFEKPVVLKKIADIAEMADGLSRDHAQNIRRANGYGPIHTGNDVEAFAAIYIASMERKTAASRWRKDAEYFRNLAAQLGDRVAFVIIGKDGEIAAVALFLFGTACAYYWLAATAETRVRGASVLAIMEGLRIAREHGCAWMHLGGGVTADPNDSLLMFKQHFGGLTLPAYSYQRIVDWQAYQALTEKAGGQNSEFFPAYRRKEAQP